MTLAPLAIEDARRILNAVRDGKDIPEHLIIQALIATGDLR